MRRTFAVLPALAALLFAAVPVSAATAAPNSPWTPAPSGPWDVAAGVRCDFPVHGEPVVDEVEQHVLETYPDGRTKRVVYRGDLVVRVTNKDTGASYDADAGGRAVVDYREDGSQFWRVRGPVLIGFAENRGTLPRGLYTVDGSYTMEIGATGYKTLTLQHAAIDALCTHIG
ncbi:hypothetical protein [Streptomyces sp. NPDC086766]|uniref:hypothetical protein n=1 Tax=Streptomyces sp. NPDC086766 TaxID=3365754 RepID=UPI003822031B